MEDCLKKKDETKGNYELHLGVNLSAYPNFRSTHSAPNSYMGLPLDSAASHLGICHEAEELPRPSLPIFPTSCINCGLDSKNIQEIFCKKNFGKTKSQVFKHPLLRSNPRAACAQRPGHSGNISEDIQSTDDDDEDEVQSDNCLKANVRPTVSGGFRHYFRKYMEQNSTETRTIALRKAKAKYYQLTEEQRKKYRLEKGIRPAGRNGHDQKPV